MCCTNRMCYACLKSDSKILVNLAKTDLDKITYQEKLKACFNQELEEQESMKICWQCIKQLRVAYQFILTLQESQAVLKKQRENPLSSVNQIKIEYRLNDTIRVDVIPLVDPEDEIEQIEDEEKLTNYAVKTEKREESSDESSDYFLSELKSNYNEFKTNKIEQDDADDDMEFNIDDVKDDYDSDDGDSDFALPIKKKHSVQQRYKTSQNKPSPPKLKETAVRFKCTLCTMTFGQRWLMWKHMRKVHTVDKSYQCTYCDKTYKQPHNLKEHLATHTGVKEYNCTYCDKKFHRISSQKRHIRSHEAPPGQKSKRTPFLCTICGKNFPYTNSLQRHIRIHMGIKKHECQFCHRRFNQSTHLRVHMRTHTGEKPYVCDTCGEAFSLNASLQKHISVVHKEGGTMRAPKGASAAAQAQAAAQAAAQQQAQAVGSISASNVTVVSATGTAGATGGSAAALMMTVDEASALSQLSTEATTSSSVAEVRFIHEFDPSRFWFHK